MQLDLNQKPGARGGYWERNLGEQLVIGELRLSPRANRVHSGNVQIFLRPMEFRLLHFFMSHPDQVHSRERLLEAVWGDWIVVGERTVDVHIRRLRATLQPLGLDSLLQTVHCRGYLFSTASNEISPAPSIN